jgi:hypothetical protein
MMFRTAALTLTLFAAGTLTVAAQESAPVILTNSMTPATEAPLAQAIARAGATDAQPTVTLWSMSQAPQKRPAMLPVLYGSYGLLAAADIVSTKKALDNGAYEANPLARGGNLGSTIAIKAGTGAATFFAAEKLWKKSRVGAVVLMVAANSLSAVVVSHNMRNARR